MAEPEERTEEAIKVRQVTDIHGNYNEWERGQPGEFSLQLVLDDGADEYVLRPPADDVRTLMMMIEDAQSMYFDTECGTDIAGFGLRIRDGAHLYGPGLPEGPQRTILPMARIGCSNVALKGIGTT